MLRRLCNALARRRAGWQFLVVAVACAARDGADEVLLKPIFGMASMHAVVAAEAEAEPLVELEAAALVERGVLALWNMAGDGMVCRAADDDGQRARAEGEQADRAAGIRRAAVRTEVLLGRRAVGVRVAAVPGVLFGGDALDAAALAREQRVCVRGLVDVLVALEALDVHLAGPHGALDDALAVA